MSEYLQRVLIYLQQELPEYREQFKVVKGKIEISISDDIPFQQAYDHIQPKISGHAGRIRNRDIDLEFCVKAENQEREFKIPK